MGALHFALEWWERTPKGDYFFTSPFSLLALLLATPLPSLFSPLAPFRPLFPLKSRAGTKKEQPKEEVLGRISLRTSGQKLRSGPPNPGKQAFWDGPARKKNPNPNFLVRIFSGGVGVFHVKGWGPKSSVCPSKPRESNFFGGISRDFAGISRKRPKSLRKKCLGSFLVPYQKVLYSVQQRAKSLERGSFRMDLSTKFGKKTPSRNLHLGGHEQKHILPHNSCEDRCLLPFGPDKSHVRVQYFRHNHPFPSSNPLKKTQNSRHKHDTMWHYFARFRL